jgi:hypothetical protein
MLKLKKPDRSEEREKELLELCFLRQQVKKIGVGFVILRHEESHRLL